MKIENLIEHIVNKHICKWESYLDKTQLLVRLTQATVIFLLNYNANLTVVINKRSTGGIQFDHSVLTFFWSDISNVLYSWCYQLQKWKAFNCSALVEWKIKHNSNENHCFSPTYALPSGKWYPLDGFKSVRPIKVIAASSRCPAEWSLYTSLRTWNGTVILIWTFVTRTNIAVTKCLLIQFKSRLFIDWTDKRVLKRNYNSNSNEVHVYAAT